MFACVFNVFIKPKPENAVDDHTLPRSRRGRSRCSLFFTWNLPKHFPLQDGSQLLAALLTPDDEVAARCGTVMHMSLVTDTQWNGAVGGHLQPFCVPSVLALAILVKE